VSSAAVGNIDVTVEYINDLVNNRDNFLKIISLIQNDLINPMQREKDDKKTAGTQTTQSTNLEFIYDPSPAE